MLRSGTNHVRIYELAGDDRSGCTFSGDRAVELNAAVSRLRTAPVPSAPAVFKHAAFGDTHFFAITQHLVYLAATVDGEGPANRVDSRCLFLAQWDAGFALLLVMRSVGGAVILGGRRCVLGGQADAGQADEGGVGASAGPRRVTLHSPVSLALEGRGRKVEGEG